MTSEPVRDDVWKSATLVETFLSGVRGGIPYAGDQIAIMLRVLEAVARDQPFKRFLDLGSGDGTLAAAVLSRFPDATATLVDFSGPMMAAAEKRIGAIAGDHQFLIGDFGDPAWVQAVSPLGPFDAIVSGFAIHHQPDENKQRVYREIFDLLAPGGMFINVEHIKPTTPWVGQLADELMVESIAAFHQRTGTGKSREDVAREYVYRPDKAANILAPIEDQMAWLQSIGFTDVDCYFRVFELAVFGGRKLNAES